MDSLPPEIALFLLKFAPLFRAEVFDSFVYLFLGLLLGEAKSGTARASVFAPPDYQPQRLSDLLARHKLSPPALMAKLAEIALGYLYPQGLPPRLFWITDSTHTEKPHSERVSGLDWFHRTKRVAGRTKKRTGHCYVYAAHLYQHTAGKATRWASLLVGALLYVKGRTIPELAAELAKHLRLEASVRHCGRGERRDHLSRFLSRDDPPQAVCPRAPAPESSRLLRRRKPPRLAVGPGFMAPSAASRNCGSITTRGCTNRR
jgi:hypothetical protein